MKLELEDRIDSKIEEKTNQIKEQLEAEISARATARYNDNAEQLAEEINKVREDLTSYVDSTIEERLEDMKGNTDTEHRQGPNLSPNSKSTIALEIERQIQQELYDKESRKMNIVVYGIAEGENEETDRIELLQMCQEGLKITTSTDTFTRTKRLGPKKIGGSDRPLLVTVKDLATKTQMFKSAKYLKEGKYSKIALKNDMTKNERVREKALWEEAKAKTTASGDGEYRVRGPPWARKIVKM